MFILKMRGLSGKSLGFQWSCIHGHVDRTTDNFIFFGGGQKFVEIEWGLVFH